MPEDPRNIYFTCPEHSARPMGLTTATDDLIGKHVKLSFSGDLPGRGEGIEHCWVKVENREGNTLFGYLDSDPLSDIGLELGAKVQFEVDQIEDIFVMH